MHDYKIKRRDIIFFIVAAMVFAVFESLSILLNSFFTKLDLFGITFNINISVTFFCFSFFIIDLVTELYDYGIARYFIFSKVLSQILFIFLGFISVLITQVSDAQISHIFRQSFWVLFSSIVASLVGYQITGRIMSYLKERLKGKFLVSRYLSSTMPGEISFSLIFTIMCFSKGRSFSGTMNIFVDLIILKFFLSAVFSLVITPISNGLRIYLERPFYEDHQQPIPFE